MSHYELKLIGDYEFDEVTSSLQKMIRRNKQYEACYWGYILHQSGYGQYVWRRLSIIACEDVGLGSPLSMILVSCLQQSWLMLHKNDKEVSLDKFLLIVQAILYLCRVRKTREADSLSNLIEENYNMGKRLGIGEIAKDSHTEVGRKLWGRFGDLKDGKEKVRLDRWFKINGFISNKAYKDKWEQALKEIWYGRIKDTNKKKDTTSQVLLKTEGALKNEP